MIWIRLRVKTNGTALGRCTTGLGCSLGETRDFDPWPGENWVKVNFARGMENPEAPLARLYLRGRQEAFAKAKRIVLAVDGDEGGQDRHCLTNPWWAQWALVLVGSLPSLCFYVFVGVVCWCMHSLYDCLLVVCVFVGCLLYVFLAC